MFFSSPHYAPRDSYAVLKISGDKHRDYLQGQITQDMRRLSPHQGIYTAITSPQGKMIADAWLIASHTDDATILVSPRDSAVELVARLRQFSLGYELRMGMVSSMGILSLQGKGCAELLGSPRLTTTSYASNYLSMQGMHVLRMPEADDEGFWLIGEYQALESAHLPSSTRVDEAIMEHARIAHGTPRFGIDWTSTTPALHGNLIEYFGISFDKGCYTGQEVIARMQWRGKNHKHLYHLQWPMEHQDKFTDDDIWSIHIGDKQTRIAQCTSVYADTKHQCYHGIALLADEVLQDAQLCIRQENNTAHTIEHIHICQIPEPCYA